MLGGGAVRTVCGIPSSSSLGPLCTSPNPRVSCIPNGHSHTFLLQIPLAQTLLYSPWSGQWKQTTFICPGLSRVSGLPTGGGRVGIHGQPHQTHSVAYCPAEGTGKGHVGVSTIPPQHSLLSTLGGGAGTTSHVTSNRQDTESLKCQASIAQQYWGEGCH